MTTSTVAGRGHAFRPGPSKTPYGRRAAAPARQTRSAPREPCWLTPRTPERADISPSGDPAAARGRPGRLQPDSAPGRRADGTSAAPSHGAVRPLHLQGLKHHTEPVSTVLLGSLTRTGRGYIRLLVIWKLDLF